MHKLLILGIDVSAQAHGEDEPEQLQEKNKIKLCCHSVGGSGQVGGLF